MMLRMSLPYHIFALHTIWNREQVYDGDDEDHDDDVGDDDDVKNELALSHICSSYYLE